MGKLLKALKANRHGHRDWLKGLLIYGHGLRVSEACDQRWDDIDLPKRTVVVRRLKGSTDSVHYLERDELAGLILNSYIANKRPSPLMCSSISAARQFGRMGIAE